MVVRLARPFAMSLLLAMTIGALPPNAFADPTTRPGSVQAVRSTAESALTVTGTVDVDAAGKVVGFTIDQPDRLPAGVLKMANENIPAWMFEPTTLPEGIRASRMRMSMLFVATRTSEGKLQVELRYPTFASLHDRNPIKVIRGPGALVYPVRAAAAEVSGIVYTVVRYDRTGTITDVMVERVNLDVVDTEKGMEKWRGILSRAAIRDVRKMRLEIPPGWFAEGELTQLGRIPMAYVMEGTPPRRYGEWYSYIPGPRSPIEWPDAARVADTAPDALAPNAIHTADAGTRRLKDTPAL